MTTLIAPYKHMRKDAPSAVRVGVGVGVGAIVLDGRGRILLVQRGPRARNEQGMWADPGGAVEPGERLAEAIAREVWEEVGIRITQLAQLGAFDHWLPAGEQWVSVAFVALTDAAGEPKVREPEKCRRCAWFALDALPAPLSPLAQAHLLAYQQRSLTASASGSCLPIFPEIGDREQRRVSDAVKQGVAGIQRGNAVRHAEQAEEVAAGEPLGA
jgi:8-oxo-dGTP diphosphatase